MHPMPVSAHTVMATSQVKIMAAIVILWPCYISQCTKLSSPIPLVNSPLNNPSTVPEINDAVCKTVLCDYVFVSIDRKNSCTVYKQ